MPIYEYACVSCGEKYEQLRNIFRNDEDIKCPKCGSKNKKRILSVFSSGSSDSACSVNRFS